MLRSCSGLKRSIDCVNYFTLDMKYLSAFEQAESSQVLIKTFDSSPPPPPPTLWIALPQLSSQHLRHVRQSGLGLSYIPIEVFIARIFL
jgi:hypothetical protein